LPGVDCVASISSGVWYKFTPSASALYTFSVSYDTATTVADTGIAIYTSAAACSGPFTLVDCNDDQNDLRSAVLVSLSANVTYYILVYANSDFQNLQPGPPAIQLRVSKPAVPANDTCAGAEVIPGSGPFPYLTSTNDITLASGTGDPPFPTCSSSGFHSVWFRFTPSTSGIYSITMDTTTATTVYNPSMAIYTASGSCSGFTQVDCNFVPEHRPSIARSFTAGTLYYIVIWDADLSSPTPGSTSVQLRISNVQKPTVTTLAATAINSTGATLNETINPNSAATGTWFEWGTSISYGNRTSIRLVGNGASTIATNDLLSGLTAGTLYHFRAVGTNIAGTNFGVDLSFAWTNSPPHITSLDPLTNGNYRVRFTATPGQVYKLISSPTLTVWSEIGTASDLGNGNFEFIDAQVPAQTRFYQIKGP
jgi:hypothetical protein